MKKLFLPAYQVNRSAPVNYVAGDLDECLDEFTYKTYDVSIKTYHNCVVTNEGVLYKNVLQLVENSIVGPKLLIQYPLRRRLRELVKHKKYFLSPKNKYILAFDKWSLGQYHFITEVLTRLIAFKAELPGYTLLLSDNIYNKTVGKELLDFFGLKPKKIAWIKSAELFLAAKIYFVNHVSLTGYINDKMIGKLQNEITYIKNIKRKIYISRGNAAYRKVLNETEVADFFLKRGYIIVSFETLSLHEQIKISMESEVLVSIHGAGLTNMMFMPKGSKIMEFRRSRVFINQCYWHLADALRHEYHYFFGEPDSDLPIEGGACCNLYIPLDKLEIAVDVMERGKNTNLFI